MINLREVEDSIKELESGSATYNNCMKLASLYIVRDELRKSQGQYNYGYYPYYDQGRGNSGRSSYGYKPMYHNEDDLMIKHDMIDDYSRRM